jgi:hypothetical protein
VPTGYIGGYFSNVTTMQPLITVMILILTWTFFHVFFIFTLTLSHIFLHIFQLLFITMLFTWD